MTPTDTPQPVDPVDTAALLALAKAATKGPWFRYFSDVVTSNPDPRDAAQSWMEEPRAERVVRHAEHFDLRDDRAIADAAFIAAANPETVTRLCEEVERLRAVNAARPYETERELAYALEEARAEASVLVDQVTEAQMEYADALIDLDRLRAFVEGVRGLVDDAPPEPLSIHPQYKPVIAAASLRALLATLDKEETDD